MKLLAISGSLRAASHNTQLLHEAVRLFGECSAEFGDLNLPLFNEELEAGGLPDSVLTLSEQIRTADAVIFATPEYNKMIPGLLKNALDWISRDKPQPLVGKPVSLMSAAAGRTGGESSQFTLRHALVSFNVNLLPSAGFALASASNGFDADGHLNDAAQQKTLTAQMDRLKQAVAKS